MKERGKRKQKEQLEQQISKHQKLALDEENAEREEEEMEIQINNDDVKEEANNNDDVKEDANAIEQKSKDGI